MHRPPAVRVIAAAGALSVLLAALAASSAWAGQFTVASCQADQLNFSTTAFADFATRGMKIVRACNPEGPGLRGLITANVVQAGSVPRGAASIATINAPVGTTLTTLRWAGTARRRDCRYALQLYADVPGGAPIPIKNIRANQRCSPGTRAQAAGYRARTFDVRGATRIVQRVICQGAPGHDACSARAANYIRTYQAQVGHRRRAAARDGDQPRTRHSPRAHGSAAPNRCTTTPRTTSASASARDRRRRRGGFDQRSCSMASPNGAFADPVPCPNGAGQITVDTHKLPEGHAAACRPGAGHRRGISGRRRPSLLASTTRPRPGWMWRPTAAESGATRTTSRCRGRTPAKRIARRSSPRSTSCARPPAAAAAVRGSRTARASRACPSQVPAPGEWTVSLCRRDAAGNAGPQRGLGPGDAAL